MRVFLAIVKQNQIVEQLWFLSVEEALTDVLNWVLLCHVLKFIQIKNTVMP